MSLSKLPKGILRKVATKSAVLLHTLCYMQAQLTVVTELQEHTLPASPSNGQIQIAMLKDAWLPLHLVCDHLSTRKDWSNFFFRLVVISKQLQCN